MINTKEFIQSEQLLTHLKNVPYDVTRHQLYEGLELYEGFHPDYPGSFRSCYDSRVYQHYLQTGKRALQIEESLARTLHDHGMHTALDRFFDSHHPRLCIGIMGGHSMLRTDKAFRQIAQICKRLTETGFYMLSGGGPGAMEATHLGAWLAGYDEQVLDNAIGMLSVAPSFNDAGWLDSAFRVIAAYPQTHYVSLGVPTWLYGHEPSTPFATHIAKFFENSIREDSILTLAYGGIIYTPGSAGTLQEIFQDAVQNHYLSFGFSSPMVFMGEKYWTEEVPVYPFLEKMMSTGRYKNLILSLSDDNDGIISEIVKFRDQNPNLEIG